MEENGHDAVADLIAAALELALKPIETVLRAITQDDGARRIFDASAEESVRGLFLLASTYVEALSSEAFDAAIQGGRATPLPESALKQIRPTSHWARVSFLVKAGILDDVAKDFLLKARDIRNMIAHKVVPEDQVRTEILKSFLQAEYVKEVESSLPGYSRYVRSLGPDAHQAKAVALLLTGYCAYHLKRAATPVGEEPTEVVAEAVSRRSQI